MLGREAGAQAVVERELTAVNTERLEPDAAAALADPGAGYPYLPYAGRSSVVGRLPGKGGGVHSISPGHIDVVPVEQLGAVALRPWRARVEEGRVWARGAGAMKGGLSAHPVAAAAAAEGLLAPTAPTTVRSWPGCRARIRRWWATLPSRWR